MPAAAGACNQAQRSRQIRRTAAGGHSETALGGSPDLRADVPYRQYAFWLSVLTACRAAL